MDLAVYAKNLLFFFFFFFFFCVVGLHPVFELSGTKGLSPGSLLNPPNSLNNTLGGRFTTVPLVSPLTPALF